MTMLRERGALDRYPYLQGLGLAEDDLGRLDVAGAAADHDGFYVEAARGESRLLTTGEPFPEGTWIAQRDLDDLNPERDGDPIGAHGFGEGFGTQGRQFGGDRSYPEEDTGGTRRVMHEDLGANASPIGEGDSADFTAETGTTTAAQNTGSGTGTGSGVAQGSDLGGEDR